MFNRNFLSKKFIIINAIIAGVLVLVSLIGFSTIKIGKFDKNYNQVLQAICIAMNLLILLFVYFSNRSSLQKNLRLGKNTKNRDLIILISQRKNQPIYKVIERYYLYQLIFTILIFIISLVVPCILIIF